MESEIVTKHQDNGIITLESIPNVLITIVYTYLLGSDL